LLHASYLYLFILCFLFLGLSFCLVHDKFIDEIDDFINYSFEEFNEIATNHGFVVRIVAINGEHLPITKDLRSNRINVMITTTEENRIISEIKGLF